ncbi:hypothetical protein EJC49_00685 [Aquibium carbonis]|uniref:Uncharacterized protein n=1 Tax=Aquibium carbonis TaxID=2495581 RepID=A0A3R9YVQ0_9HYPH|nr:hypothetical protein [Aquibium carbonis]RST88250.1 hypothetical protein EJC49_00685 [Aquibium carbonis]
MADFVAVLKKTIEGLGETTPDVREKVYQKARITIGAKLAALNPPAPPVVIDRQRKALEEAILKVEAEYAALDISIEFDEEEDPLDELDALFSSLSKPAPKAPDPAPPSRPVPAAPVPSSRAAANASTAPIAVAASTVAPAAAAARDGFRPVQPLPAQAPRGFSPVANVPEPEDEEEPEFEPEYEEPSFDGNDSYGAYDEPAAAPRHDDPLGGAISADDRRYGGAGAAPQAPARARSGFVKIAAGAAAALVVFGGLGYGLWANQDRIGSLFGGGDVSTVNLAPDAAPEPAEPLAVEEDEEEIAALSPEPDVSGTSSDNVTATDTAPKLTQRLNPDGSEVDDGPANGRPIIGEGTSVAAATQAPDAATPAPANEAAVPVGQRAIFYEERTSVAQGSAEPGATVWSLIQESPGNDLPPEPAIRAEASVPGRDIQLRMTIRRNADKSLPASHIVELIFITPENFAGGAIDNVLRMTMKETEESAGSPLAGMTAKIADGFFLLALNDEKQARDANNSLLSRQNWIDVPIVYKSGRRALMTMEKGIPGEQVFEQALRAWQEADSG